jgi:hypothetical protein
VDIPGTLDDPRRQSLLPHLPMCVVTMKLKEWIGPGFAGLLIGFHVWAMFDQWKSLPDVTGWNWNLGVLSATVIGVSVKAVYPKYPLWAAMLPMMVWWGAILGIAVWIITGAQWNIGL